MAMTQGDFTVVSWHHAVVAGRTGALAGIGAILVTSFMSHPNKWALAWATGVLTMLADVVTHPTHFGTWWTEAVTTGVGAGVLAIVSSTVISHTKVGKNESN